MFVYSGREHFLCGKPTTNTIGAVVEPTQCPTPSLVPAGSTCRPKSDYRDFNGWGLLASFSHLPIHCFDDFRRKVSFTTAVADSGRDLLKNEMLIVPMPVDSDTFHANSQGSVTVFTEVWLHRLSL